MEHHLSTSVVKVKGPDTIGTGYFVNPEGLIVTCAHVVNRATSVTITFVATNISCPAQVVAVYPAEDLALLQIETALGIVQPVALGLASDSLGHPFATYGFPDTSAGLHGTGVILGETKYERQTVYQLRSSEVTKGFSGGPILDEKTHRVIGTAKTIRKQDAHGRLGETAFCIPTETLLACYPVLTPSAVAPYRGLAHFTEAHALFFFGRSELIDHCIELLRREIRFLALSGPSGSGKSSLVQAGIIPHLRQGAILDSDNWHIITTRLGSQPLAQLAMAGLSGADNDLTTAVREWHIAHAEYYRLVLVLDQFEEVLTQCSFEARQVFVEQLARLLGSPESVTVILTLRSDLYHTLNTDVPALTPWLNKGMLTVPSTIEQHHLKEMVQKPADVVGLRFETGLVGRIVDDAVQATRSADGGVARITKTATLPLLEFTLWCLWRRRDEGFLTHNVYAKIGQVTGALYQWADQAYSQVPENDKGLAQRILVDLVYAGDAERSLPDMRQRRQVAQLVRPSDDEAAVQRIIDSFAQHRLLVLSSLEQQGYFVDAVELIHDAVLEWPTLQQWIEKDRVFLKWHQGLEQQVQLWVETHSDAKRRISRKLITDRTDLRTSELYLTERSADLRTDEQEYIKESSLNFRRWWLRAISTVLMLIIIISAMFWYQQRQADTSVAQQRDARLFRDLLSNADTIISQQPNNTALAGLLAVEAVRRNPTLESQDVLRRVGLVLPHRAVSTQLTMPAPKQTWGTGLVSVYDYTFNRVYVGSYDGWLATTSLTDSSKQVVITYTSRIIEPSITAIVPDPRHQRLFIALNSIPTTQGAIGEPGELLIVSAMDLREQQRLSFDELISSVALSPDGQLLAIGGYYGTVSVWDANSLQRITQFKQQGYVSALAFTADSTNLAIATGPVDYWRFPGLAAAFISIWDVATQQIQFDGSLGQVEESPHHLSFSADQQLLLVDSMLWNVQAKTRLTNMQGKQGVMSHVGVRVAMIDGTTVRLGTVDGNSVREDIRINHGAPIQNVAFSPHDNLVLTRDEAQLARVSSAENGHELLRVPDSIAAWFDPMGTTLISVSSSGQVNRWLLDIPQVTKILRLSRDGQIMVTVTGENSAFLHDTIHHQRRAIEGVTYADVDANGRFLLLARTDNHVAVLDLQTGAVLFDRKSDQPVTDVRFAGADKVLVQAERQIAVWSIRDGSEQAHWVDGAPIRDVRVRSDGKYVLTSTGFANPNEQVVVWRTGDGSERIRLTAGKQGVVDPTMNYIASVLSQQAIQVASVDNDQNVRVLNLQVNALDELSFSPNGRLLAVQSLMGTDVWELASGKRVANFQGLFTVMAWSNDGKHIVLINSTPTKEIAALALYEIYSAKRVQTLAELQSSSLSNFTMHFSADDTYLLMVQRPSLNETITEMPSIKIMRVTDGEILARFAVDSLIDADFEASDQYITLQQGEIIANGLIEQHAVMYLPWTPSEIIADACTRIGRDLSEQEWNEYLADYPFRLTCTGRQ